MRCAVHYDYPVFDPQTFKLIAGHLYRSSRGGSVRPKSLVVRLPVKQFLVTENEVDRLESAPRKQVPHWSRKLRSRIDSVGAFLESDS